jgi:hypothetical protein
VNRALVAAAVLALPLAFADVASAAGECDGLDVCISVPGPFVSVPPASQSEAQVVHYQLACPRGSVVGGLDAVLGDRTLDVHFLGRMGSPVNPGISTRQSVVFVAMNTRTQRTTFRPFIGCIPLSGGGGRETTALTAVLPARPPVRRVRTLVVRRGAAQTLELRCAAGERLVASSHAVAFRSRRAPAPEALAGVSVARRVRAGVVVVQARRSAAVPRTVRVEVQVHAICARSGA